LTEHIEHKPGLHCHHTKPDAECTLCTYRAMEKAHDETIELIKAIEREQNETTQTSTEDS
jgi:hypothetical protein